MTVEERRGGMGREGRPRDQFPVGMRVLAVDDDPTCLKLLETLLLKCQYHVTTTSQAVEALRMLRENKDKFDLVISDVHMPDIDGFKLLELVGLEMDLPVIMLSANSDTKAVMKGITHGACDYLLKPVRIEELKNIWQHVIRRRRLETRDHNYLDNGEDCEKNQLLSSEIGQGAAANACSDHSGKLNRKRKDQNDEDEDDSGDNAHSEDPSTQKKPRVVWSVELHRKFVAAVNQLGIEKAVPKRILDLMNVEGLTRENVASHLQKYRLYLKRISAVASQQANLVAALRGRDHSYLPMASLDGFRNYHAMAGSGQLPPGRLFQPNGLLGRLNSPSGVGLHTLAHPGIVPISNSYGKTGLPVNDLQKLQSNRLPANQNVNLLQGVPMSLELDQLLQQNIMQKPNNPITGGLPGCGLANGTSNLASAVTNNTLLAQANDRHAQSSGFGNLPVGVSPLNSNPFEVGFGDSTHLPDFTRCQSTWQAAALLGGYSTPASHINISSNHHDMSRSNVPNNPPIISHVENNPHDASSNRVLAAPLHDHIVGGSIQYQARPRGGDVANNMTVDSKMSFRSSESSGQHLQEDKQCHHNSNLILNSSPNSSLLNQHMDNPFTSGQNLKIGNCDKMIDGTATNFGTSYIMHQSKISKDDYMLDALKFQGRFSSSDSNSLLDVMIKQDIPDSSFMDGDIGCDIFSLGACI